MRAYYVDGEMLNAIEKEHASLPQLAGKRLQLSPVSHEVVSGSGLSKMPMPDKITRPGGGVRLHGMTYALNGMVKILYA